MAELSDHELLTNFARTGAEGAFAALVARHVNLVYSTARRFTSDDSLAKEITQAVFILLARKAGGISARVVLTGWLYQTARLTAANALKENFRRQRREQEAYMQSTLTAAETDDAWKQIAPVLDDAMGTLREADRNAVLLRYFENKPLAEVGAALGVSEDAARVRVNRALEKLRATLTKSGVTLGVTAIAGAVTVNAVTAAPVALTTTITTAALAGTSLTLATIAMTTLQKIAVTAALTVTIGAGIYQAKQAVTARAEMQTLQQQQAPMAEQIRQLQRERDDATNRLVGMAEEITNNKKDNSELLELRGEVGALRRAMAGQKTGSTQPTTPSPKHAKAAPHPPGAYIPKGELAFVGYATPEAALETFKWAYLQGTPEEINDAIPEYGRNTNMTQKERYEFKNKQTMMGGLVKGFQIIAKKVVAEDTVEFKVQDDYDAEQLKQTTPSEPPAPSIVPVIKFGNEWKTGGGRYYSPDWDASGSVEVLAR